MEFRATREWLKSVLPTEYAKQIRYDWCWKEIGQWYRETDIPSDIVEPIVQALIESGDGEACHLYCLYIEDRPEGRQALIDSGDGYACYCYCYYNVKDRDDVRQALIDSGDGNACYWYCLDVEDRPEVRAVAEGAA